MYGVNVNVEAMFLRSRSRSFSVIQYGRLCVFFIYNKTAFYQMHGPFLATILRVFNGMMVYGVNANVEVMFQRSRSRSFSTIQDRRLCVFFMCNETAPYQIYGPFLIY